MANILIVDDEAAIADLVEVFLKTRVGACLNSITPQMPSGAWREPLWTWRYSM